MKDFFYIPKKYDLVRIGKDNDGGYLVEKRSLSNSNFLVGMGLNDDWSFESDFVKLNNIDVHVYDHTVNRSFWTSYYKRLLSNIFIKFHLENFRYIVKFIGYLFFFRNKIHYKECIGEETSLRKVFSRIDSYPVFLKIDIEGSEYKILDELILHSKYVSGLVIEFHSVHLFQKEIHDFIKNFDLQLVHIHGNNYGHQTVNGYPMVIEMTFSKDPIPLSEEKPIFPHPLDMVNNKNSDELDINFIVSHVLKKSEQQA